MSRVRNFICRFVICGIWQYDLVSAIPTGIEVLGESINVKTSQYYLLQVISLQTLNSMNTIRTYIFWGMLII